MRILLRDLSPNTAYSLQLRSRNSSGVVSEWSKVFTIATSGDVIAPSTPTSVTNTVSGTSFKFTWAAVTTSSDGSIAGDLAGYLVRVSSPGSGNTRIYRTTDTKMDFLIENNMAVFGSLQASVRVEVAAVDTTGNISPYSAMVSATNPAPSPVANLSGVAQTDAIALKWDPNTTDLDLKQYEVWVSVTGAAGTYTKAWGGLSTSYTHPTTLYGVDHYFRVYSVDIFGTLATATQTATALRPISPFIVDIVAPPTPTGLAGTLANSTDGKSASAALTWNAVVDTDGDMSEYIIGYKPSASADWQYTRVDYTLTSTKIDNLLPYVNYDFRIRSSDYSANLSAWSTTLTKTATANAAPANVTGVTLQAGKDDVTVRWSLNTESDMANNAGFYEVQVATNSGFTTGLLTYKTASDSIVVSGLATPGTYFARVRAIDSGGVASAGYTNSTPTSVTTSLFPGQSDGAVPTGAPTLSATAGMGYIYLNWTALTNADPLVYDIYMSTTNGFTTYNATTKISEVSGTSAVIDTIVGGATLTYGTTYYFKVIARDRDGSSATASNQASAIPQKVTAADSSLTAADVGATTSAYVDAQVLLSSNGKNKITYSTSAPVNGSSTGILGDTWYVRQSVSPFQITGVYELTTAPSTWTSRKINGLVVDNLDAASITTGYLAAARIQAGTLDANVLAANTAFVTSLFVGTGGFIQSSTYVAGTTGFKLSPTSLDIGGNSTISAGSLKGGVITGTTINVGAGGVLNVDSTASIKSNNYSAGATGYSLGSAGLEINDGTIDAKTLKTATAIVGDLVIGRSADALGSLKSFGYVANTTGFKLDKNGLEINNGSISASSLRIQNSSNLMPPEYASFENVDSYYTSSFWSSRGSGGVFTDGIAVADTTKFVRGKQSLKVTGAFSTDTVTVYLGKSSTDYNIYVDPGLTYIFSIYTLNASSVAEPYTISVIGNNGATIATQSWTFSASETTFTRRVIVVNVPASGVTACLVKVMKTAAGTSADFRLDCAQFEEKTGVDSTPSQWKPPGVTTIDAGGIATGTIRSTQNVVVNGVSQPYWSINLSGSAQLGNALVRGSLLVGAGSGEFENLNLGHFDTILDTARYLIYSQGGTPGSLTRTTTVGEVISGVGSAKVTGTLCTSLGLSATMLQPVSGQFRFSFSIKSNAGGAGTNVVVGLYDGTSIFYTETLIADIDAGIVYNFTKEFPAPSLDATRIYLYVTGNTSVSSVIVDNLSVIVSDPDMAKSFISSGNFVSGATGWKIDSSGNAEFNNVNVRGTLRVYSTAQSDDGTPQETVRLGVSGEEDVFSIRDSLGIIRASIDSGGRASFSTLIAGGADGPTLDGDGNLISGVTIYGREFTDYISDSARGLVPGGYGFRTTNMAAQVSTESPYHEIQFVAKGGRHHSVTAKGFIEFGTATTGRAAVKIRYTTDGSQPTTSSTVLETTRVLNYGSANGTMPFVINRLGYWGASDVTVRMALFIAPESGTSRFVSANSYPNEIFVCDIGPVQPDTGIDREATSVPKITTATTWTSTGARTWRGDATSRGDTTDVVQGYASTGASNGNQRGLWIFPNTITSTVSGATISKVEIYAYANHWWYSEGTARIQVHGYTSLPASGTQPTMVYITQSSSWPKPGGRWVTLPNSTITVAGVSATLYDHILAGRVKGFGVGPGPSTAGVYYGRFNGGTGAKIKITYTK